MPGTPALFRWHLLYRKTNQPKFLNMTKNYNNISNEAVKYATGKEWDEWFSLLDEKDAEKLSHKEIADLLLCGGYIEKGNGWWAQSVTVAYEYAKGRRDRKSDV